MRRSANWLLLLGIFAVGCGKGNQDPKASKPDSAQAPKAPAAPPKPKTCFDDERWALPDCAGDGQGAPAWWGAKRWPDLKLVSEKTLTNVQGQRHWSLTFELPAALAEPAACVSRIKSTLKAGFPEFETLPSSTPARASFRATGKAMVMTVVCGTSAGERKLVNLDLRRAS